MNYLAKLFSFCLLLSLYAFSCEQECDFDFTTITDQIVTVSEDSVRVDETFRVTMQFDALLENARTGNSFSLANQNLSLFVNMYQIEEGSNIARGAVDDLILDDLLAVSSRLSPEVLSVDFPCGDECVLNLGMSTNEPGLYLLIFGAASFFSVDGCVFVSVEPQIADRDIKYEQYLELGFPEVFDVVNDNGQSGIVRISETSDFALILVE